MFIVCECSPAGALSEFCERGDGICQCKEGAYGRDCGLCATGRWDFPICRECGCVKAPEECTGLGVCTKCGADRAGDKCELCAPGYFGDPRKNIMCQPCKCPGGENNVAGLPQHSNLCQLEAETDAQVCNCPVGYAGKKCEICAENYFGMPNKPNGSCTPCDCSNNVDVRRTGNCNKQTGQCTSSMCLYNTNGDHCEMCKDGFYGNPLGPQSNRGEKCTSKFSLIRRHIQFPEKLTNMYVPPDKLQLNSFTISA